MRKPVREFSSRVSSVPAAAWDKPRFAGGDRMRPTPYGRNNFGNATFVSRCYSESMEQLILREFHHEVNAQFAELNGMEIVSDYGDVLAEHAALRESAGVLD